MTISAPAAGYRLCRSGDVGRLSGTLSVNGTPIVFDSARATPNHNWGFWKHVSWRWGQSSTADLSLVYGRIRPPRMPQILNESPGSWRRLDGGAIGYATNVSIAETNDPDTGKPSDDRREQAPHCFDECGDGAHVDSALVTGLGDRLFGGGLDFFSCGALSGDGPRRQPRH